MNPSELLVALRSTREYLRNVVNHMQAMLDDNKGIDYEKSREMRDILDQVDDYAQKSWKLTMSLNDVFQENNEKVS